MKFEDLFREKYRVALHSARANDKAGVIAGLDALCRLFDEQYKKDNGDSIVVKAKLGYWKDTFGKYILIIRQNGFEDRRVQKLFGLIDDVTSPSLSDILSGKEEVAMQPIAPSYQSNDGINIEGLIAPDTETKPVIAEKGETPGCDQSKGVPDDAVEEQSIDDELDVGSDIDEESPTEESSEQSTLDTPIILPIDEKDDAPTYTPNSLKSFIGQQHIVKVLLKEIAIARNEGRRHLDNILLFGNPGLGKTTLMELIAKELSVKFELLDCSQFRNSQQSLKALQNFFMRVARDNEPVVIALDEIHMLNNELQSSLLTLLNNRVYVSPLDVNGQCKRIPIDEFTFIAATTDDDKVLDTIKNRCLRLKFQMVDYTADELRQIYKNKIEAKGLTADDDAIDVCIPRSRGAIRYVNSIVEGLNSALYDDDGKRISTHIDLEVALNYFAEKGIDPMGLEAKDIEILNVLSEDTSGAVSADVLSARVGLETKKYLSEYERYLIKIGFISVSGRGRSLTEKAINYLKENK